MKKLKLSKLIASTLVIVSVLALNPLGASAEWKNNSTGWWYTEGNSYTTGWKTINGQWYYFDSNGYMKTGWVNDNGNWYYFYDGGTMAHDATIGGYYLNSAGVCTTTSAGGNTQSQTLYSEPATGDMKGWQKLRGHQYEDIAEIYFKSNGNIQSVQVKDIRKVDLNKVVEWVDDNGIKRYNTLGELYQFFTCSNTYTTDWFSDRFGSIYGDWLLVSSIKAENIVSDYLEMTGQIEKRSKVTLTPDAKFETVEVEKKDISAEDAIKNIEKSMKKESK